MDSPKFYYRQKDMIEAGKNANHTFFIASDHVNARKVTVKKYASFPSYNEYITYRDSIPKAERTFFEIILEDAPCWEFYDIDDWKTDLSPKELFNLFLDAREHFGQIIGVSSYARDYTLLDSSKFDDEGNLIKGSLHILSRNVSFKNISSQKNFFKMFSRFLETHSEYSPLLSVDKGKVHGLDKNVYTKNRCFRLEGCTKLGQERYLSRPKWHRSLFHQEFLITVDVDEQLFTDISEIVDKPNPKPKQKIRPKQVKTDQIISWFQYFSLERVTDYCDWQTFVWTCCKLGIPHEIIHEISARAVNYDECSTDSMIEAFDNDKCNSTTGTFKYWLREDLNKAGKPELYQQLVAPKRPKREKYDNGPVMKIKGFDGVDYASLLDTYDTLFIRANMGAGKSLSLRALFDERIPAGQYKYGKIIFVSSKRSLAFDFQKKNPDFMVYSDIKEKTFSTTRHRRLICQVDSMHKVIGGCDLLILDEMIDLTDQMYNSCNSAMCIRALRMYIKHSKKVMCMDANLNRCDFIRDIEGRENSLFINDKKKYHNDKTVTINRDYRDLVKKLKTVDDTFYFCSDNKKYLDKIHAQYVREHPGIKVIKITSESTDEEKREDLSEYTGVFVSPSITAGVSYCDERKYVFGLYQGQSISAHAGSQQLLRFRNWEHADLCFLKTSYSDSFPLYDAELKPYVEYLLKNNISSLTEANITINPICQSFEEDFNYYIYIDYLKRRFISKMFFRDEYLAILKEHGIKIIYPKFETDLSPKEIIEKAEKEREFEEITRALKAEKEILDEEFYKKLSEAESWQDTFHGQKMYELTDIYDIKQQPTKKWLKTYYPLRNAYKNVILYKKEMETNQTPLNNVILSGELINSSIDRQKRTFVHAIFKTLGFTDIFADVTVPKDNMERVRQILIEHEKPILTMLGRSQYPNIAHDPILFTFINDLVYSTFGFRLKTKRKQINKVKHQFLTNPIHTIFNEENGCPII